MAAASRGAGPTHRNAWLSGVRSCRHEKAWYGPVALTRNRNQPVCPKTVLNAAGRDGGGRDGGYKQGTHIVHILSVDTSAMHGRFTILASVGNLASSQTGLGTK